MAESQKNQSSAQETLQEERYLWMARAFALVALLTFVANLLMVIALSGLVPLMRVQPFYLQTQAKDRQVISIVRPAPNELNSDVLQESLVREYLLARFGIGADTAELERRWGIDGSVFAMSETSVYRDFREKELMAMTEQAHSDGLTRDVRINKVNRIKRLQGSDVWRAEIELIDMSQKIEDRHITKWEVTMEVLFQPTGKKMEWSQRLKNPLGFVVTKFGRRFLEESNGTP